MFLKGRVVDYKKIFESLVEFKIIEIYKQTKQFFLKGKSTLVEMQIFT